MPNPIPPTWNLNEYCHYHQKSGHKIDNCFCLKHEIQDLIDNSLPNPNIITKPNIRKSPLPDYHRAPPPYQKLGANRWDWMGLLKVDRNYKCQHQCRGSPRNMGWRRWILKGSGSGMGNTSKRSDRIKEKGLRGQCSKGSWRVREKMKNWGRWREIRRREWTVDNRWRKMKRRESIWWLNYM